MVYEMLISMIAGEVHMNQYFLASGEIRVFVIYFQSTLFEKPSLNVGSYLMVIRHQELPEMFFR